MKTNSMSNGTFALSQSINVNDDAFNNSRNEKQAASKKEEKLFDHQKYGESSKKKGQCRKNCTGCMSSSIETNPLPYISPIANALSEEDDESSDSESDDEDQYDDDDDDQYDDEDDQYDDEDDSYDEKASWNDSTTDQNHRFPKQTLITKQLFPENTTYTMNDGRGGKITM
tara:strand:+ start:334 stop:846 length:513 start_codon:yes stop_codon:yes gene_type:complete